MDIPRTRRWLLRSLTGGVAGIRFASAQRHPLEGDICVQGRRATLSVHRGRLLQALARTFINQYGWRVTFEEAPNVYLGDYIDATRDFSYGYRVFHLRGGRLEFSYDLGSDGRPEDPAGVLRAAIAAYHRGGYPGRYKLITAGEYLHIVPTERKNEGGVWESISSPLEAVVSLDGGNRFPSRVLDHLVELMNQASRHETGVAREPFYQGMQPRIEQRFERTEVREVLRSLIETAGRPRVWNLLYGGIRQDIESGFVRQGNYFLNII